MGIEVEWETTPKSGLTNIELSDLRCETKKEWELLSKEEQKKRLMDALLRYDLSTVKFTPTYWDE